MVAAIVAATAWRLRWLSGSGAAAATGVGTAAVGAGWSWAVLLLLFFGSSVALTRLRAEAKAARTGAVVAKGGPRDATQVLANGGAFALAAVLWLLSGWEACHALGAAALAAAASDTWATEIGTLAGRPPRAVVGWRPVPTGTSGAVSVPGVVAAIGGAGLIALAASALAWPPGSAAAALLGGVAGSTIDTVLGGTVQVRRRCDACGLSTERERHSCGAPTRVAGGMPWLNNDAVNAVSTIAGGLVGLLVAAQGRLHA